VLGTPRFGFDVVLDFGLTAGAALGYMRSHGSGDALSQPDSKSVVIGTPRIGLLVIPTSRIGLWFRGGVTAARTSVSIDAPEGWNSFSRSEPTVLWNLTLDPQLLIVAAPRSAIAFGVLADVGLGGSFESGTLRDSAYGMIGGLCAIF